MSMEETFKQLLSFQIARMCGRTQFLWSCAAFGIRAETNCIRDAVENQQ